MDCRFLIVEDSDQIREAVYDFFVSESKGHFVIDTAADGISGLELVRSRDYDLVILDIMLPGTSGFDICRAVRSQGNCPVIFLTALGTEDNILKGYEVGADEYMVKPFSLKVLYAKCLALLNRTMTGTKDRIITVGAITINVAKMQVFSDNEPVELPPKEYFLLKFLADNPGTVFARNVLLDKVWGRDFAGTDRVVDNHIKNLRRCLGESGGQVKTVFGVGYKLTGGQG